MLPRPTVVVTVSTSIADDVQVGDGRLGRWYWGLWLPPSMLTRESAGFVVDALDCVPTTGF